MAGHFGDNATPLGTRIYEERRQTLIKERGGPGRGDLGDYTAGEYVMLIEANHMDTVTALRPLDEMVASRAMADIDYEACQTVEEVEEKMRGYRESKNRGLASMARTGIPFTLTYSLELEAGKRRIDVLEGRPVEKQTYVPPSLIPRSVMLCEYCPAAQITGDTKGLNIHCDALTKWTYKASIASGALVLDQEVNLPITFCEEHRNQILELEKAQEEADAA
jgi:hypothetical protein